MANLNLLSPEIRAAANDAWQRAQEGQKAQSLNTSQGFGSAALLNTLNADVREAREKGKTGFNSLDTITNPETQRAFEKAFTLSERLVSYIGLSAPTPEQMVSVDVNLQYLAEQFVLMEQGEGVAPHVVLAPHGLGKQNWLTIGQKMATDTTIPSNSPDSDKTAPYSQPIPGELYMLWTSLNITDDVWCNLDQAPISTTTPELSTPPVYRDDNGIQWTLRLISGGMPTPQFCAYHHNPATHQTLAEGVTDKLTTVLAGYTPTDQVSISSSWCWQPNVNVANAPYICWDDWDRQMRITLLTFGPKTLLGVRYPVG